MFSNKLKKDAIHNLEEKVEHFEQVNKYMINNSEALYNKRLILKSTLTNVNYALNHIANKPHELELDVKKVKISLNNYQDMLDGVEIEIKKNNIKTGVNVGASIAAGAGVAAFAPTAAMGIATTFGVASTGTAISALSGAAATNAALAWLGGGAIAAGGGGIAAGGTVLTVLAGPVAWAIGGSALLGSTFLLNGKNKKIANEVNNNAAEIEAQIKVQQGLSKEIQNLMKETDGFQSNLSKRLETVDNEFPSDYLEMNDDQKYQLGVLVNFMNAGAQSLIKGVGGR